MADYTVEISLADHKRGDKWPGIPTIGPILVNGSQPATTLDRIRAQFVHPSGLVYTLDSEVDPAPDAEITITNAVTWAATVPEVQDFLQLSGDWQWDMEFWETGDDSPVTFYKGTITVHDDITKD